MLSVQRARSTSQANSLSNDESDLSHRFFSKGIINGVVGLFTDITEAFCNDPAETADRSEHISTFYHQLVLQASLSNSIICKALTALCGLYERTSTTSDGSPRQIPEFVACYSEAVTDLRRMSGELSPDIILIVSILFANCEYFLSDIFSARQHLEAGARILQHAMIDNSQLSPDFCNTLGTIFEVLNHDLIRSNSLFEAQYTYPSDEMQYADLAQANDDLLQAYSWALALRKVGNKKPLHIMPMIHHFRRWASLWVVQISTLEQTLAYHYRPWLHLLHAQHHALTAIIDQSSSSDEMSSWDNHKYDNLVLSISSFFQTYPSFTDMDTISDRPFLDSIGFILPLFIVILQCPDLQTCQIALSLLQQLKVQEGVWNSCCAYAVASFVVKARCAAQFDDNNESYSFNGAIPTAGIARITPLAQDRVVVTIKFPQNTTHPLKNDTTTATIGSFCACQTVDLRRLRLVMEAGGHQGPVLAQPLVNCRCQQLERKP